MDTASKCCLSWNDIFPSEKDSKNRLLGYIWKVTHLQCFQSLSPQILKATDQFTPFKAKHRVLGVIRAPRSPMCSRIKSTGEEKKHMLNPGKISHCIILETFCMFESISIILILNTIAYIFCFLGYISLALILWIFVVWFHRSNSRSACHWAHQTVWNQIMSFPALLTRSPLPAETQQGQLAMLILQQPAQTQTIISNGVSHQSLFALHWPAG